MVIIYDGPLHCIYIGSLNIVQCRCSVRCIMLLQLVLPEYLLHGLCVFLFLLAAEWLSVIINAPLVAYHVNRYVVVVL